MVVRTGCACKIVYFVPSQSQCHSDTHCISDAGNEQHMAEAAWHTTQQCYRQQALARVEF